MSPILPCPIRGKVHFPEEMKKEKKTNFLKGLRSKREGLSSFPVPEDSHSDFLDIIRVQMEARFQLSDLSLYVKS